MTFHTVLATFRTATVHDPVVRGPAGPSGCAGFRVRDSGSHFHANNTLTKTSTAAATPGPRGPQSWWAQEPRTAPLPTPRLVAADNQTNARGRRLGGRRAAASARGAPGGPPADRRTMR